MNRLTRARMDARDEGLEAAARLIESRYPLMGEPYSPQAQYLRGYLGLLVEGIRAMKQPTANPSHAGRDG